MFIFYSLLKRGIIIDNKLAIKHQTDEFLTYANIIMITVTSIFLPYIFAGFILVGLGVYLVLNKQTRKIIFLHKYSKYVVAFFTFYLLVALIYGNWFGVAAGFGLILAVAIGFFQSSFMTAELYERVLTLVCILSITSSSCAITQKFVISMVDDFYNYDRISAMFLHPNYFGTITATVIIICAYKLLTSQESKWLYYTVGAMNVISLYLCGSMFAWVEVFIGIAVLLLIMKKYQLLFLWVSAAAAAGFLIFIMNINLIPRLSDAGETIRLRLKIWKFAVKQIIREPLFGHGALSCAFLSLKNGDLIPHAHSIYLDYLMNYGLLGTVFLTAGFIKYYKLAVKLVIKEKQNTAASLILAVTAAALIHGTTDHTLFWIQTLPLFIFLLSGISACGNRNKKHLSNF